jgi:hypothetical protein
VFSAGNYLGTLPNVSKQSPKVNWRTYTGRRRIIYTRDGVFYETVVIVTLRDVTYKIAQILFDNKTDDKLTAKSLLESFDIRRGDRC